jgi:hypothetical protein
MQQLQLEHECMFSRSYWISTVIHNFLMVHTVRKEMKARERGSEEELNGKQQRERNSKDAKRGKSSLC